MPSCTIAPTNLSEERNFDNTNELLDTKSVYYNPNVIGIKTGFTTPAGHCLISGYATDNIELISVILDTPQNTSSGSNARFIDTNNLFNFGIENYSKIKIAEKSTVIDTVKVKNADIGSDYLDAVTENEVYAVVPNSFDINSLSSSMKISLKDELVAPINQNDIIGTVSYTIDGIVYTENLLAGNTVKPTSAIVNLLKLVVALILLFIAYRLMYVNRKKSKNAKKHGKYVNYRNYKNYRK